MLSISDFEPCMNLETRRFCSQCWLRAMNKLIRAKRRKLYGDYGKILTYVENMAFNANILLNCKLLDSIRRSVCTKCSFEKCKTVRRKNKVLIDSYCKSYRNLNVSKLIYLIKENCILYMSLQKSSLFHEDEKIKECYYIDFIRYVKKLN